MLSTSLQRHLWVALLGFSSGDNTGAPKIKILLAACIYCSLLAAKADQSFVITEFNQAGQMQWSNAFPNGVCSVETAESLSGPWIAGPNFFTSNQTGRVTLGLQGLSAFHRVRSVDVSGTLEGFTNLVYSYGLLETVAGTGAGQTDGVSYWQPWYEGGPAQLAALSRPHFAQADAAGNIYIADKNSHAILKISPDQTIRTFAGTHVGGFNGEGPDLATNLQLNLPNGAWVRADGTVYILDTDNGRVRRVDTNGIMRTIFQTTGDGSALAGGRGLWVNDDESLAYFCAGTRLRKWTPAQGLKTIASGFTELGPLFVEPDGNILVCDRGANYAYRITPSGAITVFAGNGKTSGGGDGELATQTGLDGVRGIWPLPNGGHVLLTHDGCQLWYRDTSGIIRLMLNGASGRTHAGDAEFFYSPEPKISEGRSVTVDYDGNIIVTESDWGYVRRIRFQRLID